MAAASNASVLSHSHTVIRAKKRARQEQIKEIVFNDDARREFITGFHKRKVQRTEEKRKKAQERDKQQRLEARREGRKALAEQAQKNAAAVEKALGAVMASDDDVESDDDRAHDDAREFEDEEQLATVTVVEDFTTDDLILGPESHRLQPKAPHASASPAPVEKDMPQRQPKAKPKVDKFRYEGKAARKAAKNKQKARQAYKAAAGRMPSNKRPSKRR